MEKPLLSLLILFVGVGAAFQDGRVRAQILDDFSDGDIQRDPEWIGDTEAWTVTTWKGDRVLASNGGAASDTIHLAVPTDVSFGTWEFLFAHQDVNLSTFNGARVFICASGPSVLAEPAGYYVQIGTNNGDGVSFWRVDGSWTTRRALGRSATPLAAGDSSRLYVQVVRDASNTWLVTVNDTVVTRVQDAEHTSCGYLALWVKHSAAGRSSFFFDAFRVAPLAAPPPEPPLPRPFPMDVVINEVQADPPPFGSEFIELLNRTSTTLDLSTLTIRDARSRPIRAAGERTALPPGAYAVLVEDGPSFSDQFRTVPYLAPASWAPLNNGGDIVVLEADGVLIDSVSYEADAVVQDRSLERIDPDAPSDAFNFAPSADAFGATPGARNSRFERDTEAPDLHFVHESGEAQLDLYFSEPIRTDATPAAYVRVGNAAAEVLRELEPGVLRAEFADPIPGPTVNVRAAVDRRGNRTEHLSSPIAFRPGPFDLIINEILYEPLADDADGRPDQVEYIEVFNRSRRRVLVDGVYRTRDPDETGDADTARVETRLVGVDPGAFLVLAADRLDAVAPSVVVPSLGLRNTGDRIRLHGPTGVVLDALRYDPSWHHPDVLEHRGISLERIDSHGKSGDPGNWTSSVASEGGTPGRTNSVQLASATTHGAVGMYVQPNPFSPDRDGFEDVVKISCVLPLDVLRIRLRIFDVGGVMVRELVPAGLVAGTAAFLWDGRDDGGRRLRTGIYIALIEAYDDENAVARVYKKPIVLARRH